jgi:hypothetical protein
MAGLTPYLRGGGLRPDAVSGLQPGMQNALAAMLADAPGGLTINSAYRSPELQATLYEQALERYGSEAEARRWVAPPGRSQHNHGNAVDLGFESDEARQWAHANAERYGLSFPLSNEDWHIELAGARGGQVSATSGPPLPEQRVNAMASQPVSPEQARPPTSRNQLAQMDAAPFMNAPFQVFPVDFTPRRLTRG